MVYIIIIFFNLLEHSQPILYNAFFAAIDDTVAKKHKNGTHNRSFILKIFLQNATVHM